MYMLYLCLYHLCYACTNRVIVESCKFGRRFELPSTSATAAHSIAEELILWQKDPHVFNQFAAYLSAKLKLCFVTIHKSKHLKQAKMWGDSEHQQALKQSGSRGVARPYPMVGYTDFHKAPYLLVCWFIRAFIKSCCLDENA